MNERSPARRFYFTPIQRVAALLVFALAVALVVVVNRTKPRLDQTWDWRFPDQFATFVTPSLGSPSVGTMLQVVATNASNVFQFYRQNLHLPPATGPLFMARSRGLFFSRNMEETGLIPSIAPTLRAEMFLNYQGGQAKILVVSQFAGDTNSAIWISTTETTDSRPAPTVLFLPGIEYPGSARGSGGSVQHATAHSYTVRTNLAAIESFYAGNFGTNVTSAVQSNALQVLGDKQAQLFRLPGPPRTPTNEAAFLLLTTRTMSFIHAAETGSNTVLMSIGVVTR
jgi:hypothetical protein